MLRRWLQTAALNLRTSQSAAISWQCETRCGSISRCVATVIERTPQHGAAALPILSQQQMTRARRILVDRRRLEQKNSRYVDYIVFVSDFA